MTEFDPTSIAPIWQRRFWVPALLVLALFAFGAHGGSGRLDGTAYSFGQVTGGALFLWLVFYIVISRKLSWKHSLVAFAVLFTASLVGKMAMPNPEHATTVAMVDSLSKQLATPPRTQDSTTNATPVSTSTTSATPAAPDAPETGVHPDNPDYVTRVMLAYASKIMQRSAAISQEYAQAIDAIGWNSLLNAERLKKDVGFAHSELMITQARAILARSRTQFAKMLESVPGDVEKMNVSDATKHGFIKGFNESLQKGDANAAWDLEAKMVDETSKIIEELKVAQWTAKDKQIVFTAQESADRYNAHLAIIRELERRRAAISAAARTSTQEKLNELK